MAQKKRGLGKNLSDLGLSELLGSMETASSAAVAASLDVTTAPAVAVAAAPSTSTENRIFRLPVSKIQPGRYQPRQHFDQDALEELSQSIKAQGIIQPIVVRRVNEGYEIIAGERRWRASQMAGLAEVPAIIQDLPDQAIVAISLIENIQREDLNVLEEAVALDRLLNEFQLTHLEVAEAVGKSRAQVTNLLRLLKLNDDVKQLLVSGKLDMGHARALLSLPSSQQSEVADKIIINDFTVRQTEEYVKRLLNPVAASAPTEKPDPNVKRLEGELADKLSAKVMIRQQPKGKGQLVIHYNSLDELDGILTHIH